MYTIVIPTYHNFDGLAALISNIALVTKRYKPESIIIVNDGIDEQIRYASEILASELLPTIQVINIPHSGPLIAMQTGLDAVQTEYAVFLHDDTRLINHISIHGHEFVSPIRKQPRKFSIQIVEDPLSLLYNHIINQESQESNIRMVSCFALYNQGPYFIQGGLRAIGRNGLPFTPHRKSKFERTWLDGQFAQSERWRPVHSIDTQIFIIWMEAFRQVRLNITDYIYIFGFDDFCARFRQAGFHIYFTNDTVVYHPKASPIIEGKLSKPTPEHIQQAIYNFTTTWKNSPLWEFNSIYTTHSTQDINPDTIGIS